MDRNLSDGDRFVGALRKYAPVFEFQLNDSATAQLRAYYEFVTAWNARLHLVAPCSPEEFATRHVLESLLAVAFMKVGASIVDVGSGAGLPIIPCLIARPDLTGTLVESSKKKAVFLREALNHLRLGDRANVSAERFDRMPAPEAACITCRALERFMDLFPDLVKWSIHASLMLLFAGDNLREQIAKVDPGFSAIRIPESEQRYLFIVKTGR